MSSISLKNINDANTWQTPTLTNSWVNYGGVWNNAQYRLGVTGFVELRGFIKSGNFNVIFTLPAGYRPLAYCTFVVAGSSGSSTKLASTIEIHPDGTVTPTAITNQTNDFLSLDGIRFRVD